MGRMTTPCRTLHLIEYNSRWAASVPTLFRLERQQKACRLGPIPIVMHPDVCIVHVISQMKQRLEHV